MRALKQAEFYQRILRLLITSILIPLSMTWQSATWRVGSSDCLQDQAPEPVTSFFPILKCVTKICLMKCILFLISSFFIFLRNATKSSTLYDFVSLKACNCMIFYLSGQLSLSLFFLEKKKQKKKEEEENFILSLNQNESSCTTSTIL
jgi:hypothetical protein